MGELGSNPEQSEPMHKEGSGWGDIDAFFENSESISEPVQAPPSARPDNILDAFREEHEIAASPLNEIRRKAGLPIENTDWQRVKSPETEARRESQIQGLVELKNELFGTGSSPAILIPGPEGDAVAFEAFKDCDLTILNNKPGSVEIYAELGLKAQEGDVFEDELGGGRKVDAIMMQFWSKELEDRDLARYLKPGGYYITDAYNPSEYDRVNQDENLKLVAMRGENKPAEGFFAYQYLPNGER